MFVIARFRFVGFSVPGGGVFPPRHGVILKEVFMWSAMKLVFSAFVIAMEFVEPDWWHVPSKRVKWNRSG